MKLFKKSICSIAIVAMVLSFLFYDIDAKAATNYTNLYTIVRGDSLWLISRKYGITVAELMNSNSLKSSMIYPGQVLKIPNKVVDQKLNEDIYWLSRIIEAEASGESYTGKVAVGNVVMNRKISNQFPNTIKGVIFEYSNGIPQFSPVAEGTIYNTPSASSTNAAKDTINGSRPVGSSTYFFNPNKSSAPWIVKNKTYVTRIGNHVFYK